MSADRCMCEACTPQGNPFAGESMRFIACAICGNKRCPHAADHRNACTNSNEPGQPGSSYPDNWHTCEESSECAPCDRAALAPPNAAIPSAEPVAWRYRYRYADGRSGPWRYTEDHSDCGSYDAIPLYAAPPNVQSGDSGVREALVEVCEAALAFMWHPKRAGVEPRLEDAIERATQVHQFTLTDHRPLAAIEREEREKKA